MVTSQLPWITATIASVKRFYCQQTTGATAAQDSALLVVFAVFIRTILQPIYNLEMIRGLL